MMGSARQQLKEQQKNNSNPIDFIESLPTLPAIASQVSEMIQDENVSAQQILSILEKDQTLTGKVLKLANSSYYSIPGGASSLKKAVLYIGFQAVSQLALSISVLSMFEKFSVKDFTFHSFWMHSLGVGVFSETMAEVLKIPHSEEFFTAGLLHDMGKLALYQYSKQSFENCLVAAQAGKNSFFESEKNFFPWGHAEVGHMLAVRWRLSKLIQDAIAYHHYSSSEKNIQIIQFANQFCNDTGLGHSGNYNQQKSKLKFEDLDLSLEMLESIKNKFQIKFKKAGTFLNVIGS